MTLNTILKQEFGTSLGIHQNMKTNLTNITLVVEPSVTTTDMVKSCQGGDNNSPYKLNF